MGGLLDRVYYGWIIVAITLVMQITVTGARYSFGVFLEPIASAMDWSIGLLSLVISGFLLMYGLTAPLVGNWVDKFGARTILLVGTAVMGIGMIIAGLSTNVWQFAFAIVILVGWGYSGLSPVVQSALVSRWFEASKGRALGISSSGTALGQMLVVPVAMFIGLSFGWRVGFYALGLAVFAFIPLGFLGLRDDPRQLGLNPDGADSTPGKSGKPRPPADYRMFLGSTPFWLLTTSFFGCGFTMLMLVTHLPNMMIQMGISPTMGGLAISLIGGASAVGTILLSSLSDRFGRRFLLTAVYGLRVVMLLLFVLAPSAPVVLLFSVFFGLTWIVTSPLTAGLSGDFYGSESVGRIYGICYLSHQIGAFIGTSAAGYIFDLTGGYSTALWLSVGITTASFLLATLIRDTPMQKNRAPAAGEPLAVE